MLTAAVLRAGLAVLLLSACSTGGSGKPGDASVPCETVIAMWSLVQCPGAPPLFSLQPR